MPYTPSSGALAGRTFANEYEYRRALQQQRGYSSVRAGREAPLRVRGPKDVARLTRRQQEDYAKALRALAVSRRDDIPIREAARDVGITPEAVRRFVPGALERRGRYTYAKDTDRAYRPLEALTTVGLVPVDVRSARQSSLIGAHWNAVRAYLDLGDESGLGTYRGVRIGGFELQADPDAIFQAYYEGDLDEVHESIYRIEAMR